MSVEGTTQGDNLAMSFYALGIAQMLTILRITSPNVSVVSLADDVTGTGTLENLKTWWDNVITQGSKFGYYVNQSKYWLIIKTEENLEYARTLFRDSNVNFTTERKRHLGASIGNSDFQDSYAEEKINEWCAEIKKLTEYAKTQPQAAYAAFCHCEIHKYTYFMRTIPGMEHYLKPLDDVFSNKFMPILFESIITEQDRMLYSLTVKCGGMGLTILTEIANMHYNDSKKITAPLVSLIILPGNSLPDEKDVNKIKQEVLKQKEEIITVKTDQIESELSQMTLRGIKDAQKREHPVG